MRATDPAAPPGDLAAGLDGRTAHAGFVLRNTSDAGRADPDEVRASASGDVKRARRGEVQSTRSFRVHAIVASPEGPDAADRRHPDARASGSPSSVPVARTRSISTCTP